MPTQRGTLTKDDNGAAVGWNKTVITAAAPTTTAIKESPGVLGKIVLNGPVATGIVTIYDALSASGTPIAIITVPVSPLPVELEYNCRMDIGITIITATAAQNITVTWI